MCIFYSFHFVVELEAVGVFHVAVGNAVSALLDEIAVESAAAVRRGEDFSDKCLG